MALAKDCNNGLSQCILDILDKHTDMWVSDLLNKCKIVYPKLTQKQLHGILSSLVKRDKILHLTRGAYGCLDYPYR